MNNKFFAGTTGVMAFFAMIVTFSIQTEAKVTILENTRERLSFSWEMDALDTTSVSDGAGGRMVSLGFSGSNIAFGEYGEAMVPGVAFALGVPSAGSVSATVSPSEVKTVRLSHPAATWREPNSVGRMEGTTFSSRWLAAPGYNRYRTLRVARLLFRPVVYDDASRSVSLLTRGTVTISFPPVSGTPARIDPNSDYERMLRSMVMNYDVAKSFRTTAGLARRTAAADYPLPYGSKVYTFRIGDGHDGLNEGMTNENGIMKLSGQRIYDLFGNVSIATIRLYASFKGMLPDSMTSGSIPNGVHEIPLLRVDGNGNGMVDGNDFFIAYVTGASDWAYDSVNYEYRYQLDLYDDYRTYWLTASGGGRSITAASLPSGSADTTCTSFLEHVQYRQSKTRRDGNMGDRRWIWKVLSERTRTFEQQITLPGLVEGDTGWIQIRGDSKSGSFDMSLGGKDLCDGCSLYGDYPVVSWGDGTVLFSFDEMESAATGKIELEYFNVLYPRKLAVGDEAVQLTVRPPVPAMGKTIAYRAHIATRQRIYLLRTTPDGREVALIDTVTFSEPGTYEWVDSAVGRYRYVLCNESGLLELPEVEEPASATGGFSRVVRNLRSTTNTSDFLIIAPTDFLPAADSLARHKRRVGFDDPVVVDVNDIYRYFSGGDKDVVAIRNLIDYIYRNWKNGDALEYVVLFGLGHYDSKGYISNAQDYIPVYIHRSECMEDFFTCVGSPPAWGTPKPQMALGRLPCGTVEQAWDIVRKIVQVEDPSVADMSEWRNRVLFVADDDMQGAKKDQVALSTPHQLSSDRTFTVIDTLWPSIDVRKVYLYEYEWDQAWQKPGASRALINEINNGVGYVNFFGHGADITWTDEYILTGDMVSTMNNTGRYPVISAFSCSVGKFDIPGKECLSGILARAADVGSIASISSTREAYASANENLAKTFYRFLFDSTGTKSIGMAMIAAYSVISGDGYRTYCLLGDPSFRAVRPTHKVSLAIDGSYKNDTLMAMQKVVITGTVDKKSGGVDASFGGSGAYVSLGLFNAPDSAFRKDGGEDQSVRYMMPGAPVFTGKVTVSGGKFSQTVLLPKNLSFDKPGVKLIAYAWKEQSEQAAVGSRRDIIFHGTDVNENLDESGPRITVRPTYDDDRLSGGSASFSDHVTVQMPVSCEVELFDESGIDASGMGPDEGVTLEIEGVYARQNVNNKFQFKEGDFRRGVVSVVYEEEALKPGSYQMVVTARDLVGNLSKSRFTLEVTDWDELKFDHVLNFPNPVRMGKETRFYCHTNYTAQQYYGTNVRLTLKIYTLGGRLLRVIKDARNGERWNGRDQHGNLLSPDVYLYQFIGEDYDQSKTVKSKIMKLVILPPK